MISAGRSRQRDHISGLLRDSTQALLTSWTSPFAFVTTADNSPSAGSVSNGSNNGNGSNGNGGNNSKLEAAGAKVTDWLLADGMQKVLSSFMRPASGRKAGANSSSASITSSIAADLVTEGKLDKRCQDAFAAVKEFENNHCLSVQSMGVAYTAAKPGLVTALLGLQSQLGLRDDVVHDAVLLVDRAMSASFKVRLCWASMHAWLTLHCNCYVAVFLFPSAPVMAMSCTCSCAACPGLPAGWMSCLAVCGGCLVVSPSLPCSRLHARCRQAACADPVLHLSHLTHSFRRCGRIPSATWQLPACTLQYEDPIASVLHLLNTARSLCSCRRCTFRCLIAACLHFAS